VHNSGRVVSRNPAKLSVKLRPLATVPIDGVPVVCFDDVESVPLHWLTLSESLAVLFSHGWDIMASDLIAPLSGYTVSNPAPIIAGPGRVGQCLQLIRYRLKPAPGGIDIGSGRGRVGI
jgi:hypothetical protein